MKRTLSDLTEADAVERALDEFDKLGRDAFLAKYGYGPARTYFVRRGTTLYDSKAIAGAAIGYQFPADGPLSSTDFSGGDNTVAKKLTEMGYLIENPTVMSGFQSSYQRLKTLFLLAWPGFRTFGTYDDYIQEERTYKDELLGLFQQEVAPLLTRADTDSALGEKCLALLQWPLRNNNNKAQNLVGWRVVNGLLEAVALHADGQTRFGMAIRRLLVGTPGLAKRIDTFVKSFNEIASSKHPELRSRGAQTAITTFYLGLSDPTQFMFIKSTQFDDVLDACERQYQRMNRVLLGTDYERLLGVAKQILDALARDGFAPKDLVDVQGFLWVGLTQAEGLQKDGDLIIRLTAGAIKNRYLNLSRGALEFFGEQYVIGDKKKKPSKPIKLTLPDQSIIEGQIIRPKDGATGQLRAPLKSLFQDPDALPANVVRIHPIDPGHYRLTLGHFKMPPNTVIRNHNSSDEIAKNTILYGPPGTGKTYKTAELAVRICLGFAPANREEIRALYDQLRKAGRIGFVTFHQSFAYEEFVEGLRPITDLDGDSEVRYEVRDGVFKRICSLAGRAAKPGQESAPANLRERRIFKMSLGNSQLSDDASVYEESLRSNQLVLNWGGPVDYGACESAEDIRKAFATQSDAPAQRDYSVIAIDYFKNLMQKGDLVLISDGNTRFRAIGEVTGNYEYIKRIRFPHVRAVRWLATFDPSLPIETISEKRLSQMTIYRPDPSAIKWDALEELLRPKSESQRANYVLIIDEINRANISKVLGELITLLEPDKRLGASEELRAELPYSRDMFGVPDNVYVIGTMNTADRSLALLDTALRRRFEFREMRPELDLLKDIVVQGVEVAQMLSTVNDRIELLYDREHAIGHAFFLSLRDDPSIAALAHIFGTKILPLLQEYFFEDWERIRLVLGDNQKSDPLDQFILVRTNPQLIERLFGGEDQNDLLPDGKRVFDRNAAALERPGAYQGIYRNKSPIVPRKEPAAQDV